MYINKSTNKLSQQIGKQLSDDDLLNVQNAYSKGVGKTID